MQSSALTTKGQVTIPSDFREKLGLRPGDRIGFMLENDHLILFRKLDNIEASFGICKSKRSASLHKIEEAIRKKGSKNDIS